MAARFQRHPRQPITSWTFNCIAPLLQWNGQTYVESSNSETAKNPVSVVENRIVRLRSWKKD
ncbi:MAG TPA: hypothetical protein DHC76_03980 [Rhodobacteraceae bacterium]|nr:hypothetical protein [Paracoccaceae bacterium]